MSVKHALRRGLRTDSPDFQFTNTQALVWNPVPPE